MMLRKILVGTLVWLAAMLPAQATSVLPQTLNNIVDGAAVAFQGVCVANRTERDAAGSIVTYTTFEVRDVLKGSVAATHTIKQVGGTIDGIAQRFEGVPTFAEGQEYVVFLYGVSSAGYSSPVGLFQGQFIVRDTGGGPTVTNGLDFRELLKDQQPAVPTKSKVDSIRSAPIVTKQIGLDDFKQIVREQVRRAK